MSKNLDRSVKYTGLAASYAMGAPSSRNSFTPARPVQSLK